MERAYKIPGIYTLRDNQLPGSIFRVLAYFDVFDYPLTATEIFECSDAKGVVYSDLKKELDTLVTDGAISKTGPYYYIGYETCIKKRELANRYSEKLMLKARKYSRLISRFPFVRGVCISGSLSKNNAHENADVDYFIITAANRLWICRTLLALYKKVFLLNSRKYFCINYFVDTNNLEIIDKNIYTATEIAFLIPVYNHESFFSFLAANTWVGKYYPEKKIEVSSKLKKGKAGKMKRAIEYFLNNRAGNFIDNAFLKLTVIYRHLKFRNLPDDEFRDKLRAMKGVSKHHPNCFQKKVLKKYQDNLIRLEAKYGLGLN